MQGTAQLQDHANTATSRDIQNIDASTNQKLLKTRKQKKKEQKQADRRVLFKTREVTTKSTQGSDGKKE